MAEKTVGEKRVRIDYGVATDDAVTKIKKQSANLIDTCEAYKTLDPRLAALAQSAYEEAAMWAVKLVTTS